MSEAFVYVWTNITNNMFYIGKHLGSEDDGYISSGKHFMAAYNQNPNHFERTIVFRGTHQDVRQEESKRIDEAIRTVGYERIYNLTTYQRLKSWSRKCLHCGATCCPENKQWADAFEKYHFSNCNAIPKPAKVIREKIPSTKPKNRISRREVKGGFIYSRWAKQYGWTTPTKYV